MTNNIDAGMDNLPEEPISQQTGASRWNLPFKLPTFMRDLPHMRLPKGREYFELLPPDELEKILAKASPELRKEIEDDMKILKEDLFQFFIRRDRLASEYQNNYRFYQLMYVLLAFGATIFGSLQALAMDSKFLVWVAFAETLIALTATMVAALSTYEPPLPKWVENRRIAESLRQEYFRYLTRSDPYDDVADKARRKMLLSRRAAEINQGRNPDSSSDANNSSSRPQVQIKG